MTACLVMATGNANAQWTGGVEAGASIGSDQRPALRFFGNYASDPLSHFIFLDWIRESTGTDFRLGYNPTWRVSHSFYSFGRFSIQQNDSNGIDQQVDALVGVGNNLFQRGSTRAKIEAGVGGQHLEFVDTSDDTEAFLFLGSSVSSSLLALLRFDASASSKISNDTATIDAEVGLSVPIAPNTQLRYVYRVTRYNFDNRENIVDEDNFFTVSYGF